jgi:hypothetical protein
VVCLEGLAADDVSQVVLFSSTAIALYGYDQGMMSLINTNKDYLSTMGLEEESPQVGVIVVCIYSGISEVSARFPPELIAVSRSIIWDVLLARYCSLLWQTARAGSPRFSDVWPCRVWVISSCSSPVWATAVAPSLSCI